MQSLYKNTLFFETTSTSQDVSTDLPRTAFQISGAMSVAVGGGIILMVVLILFMIAMRQRCAKRKPRSAPPPSSQPASPDKLREKEDSESDDRNPDIIPSDTDQMQVMISDELCVIIVSFT